MARSFSFFANPRKFKLGHGGFFFFLGRINIIDRRDEIRENEP